MSGLPVDLALAWPSHDENTLSDLVERLGKIETGSDAAGAA